MIRVLAILALALAVLGLSAEARAQVYGPPAPGSPAIAPDLLPAPAITPDSDPSDLSGTDAAALLSGQVDAMNPLRVLAGAAEVLPGQRRDSTAAPGIATPISILLLLTVITLVPSVMLMCTCFVRILIVLGLLKQAIGAQSVPPPQVITALALFMTMLVMSPTVKRIHDEAVVPYQNNTITDLDTLWARGKQPVRDFMFDQIEATGNWSSVYMVLNYRGIDTSAPEALTRADVDMVSLVPAFMLSELKTAFLMGFRIYLPFLVIDMVISALLISMSMMMLPPVLISLPFKILLFVLVDGWQLVVGGLMSSFVQPGEIEILRAAILHHHADVHSFVTLAAGSAFTGSA